MNGIVRRTTAIINIDLHNGEELRTGSTFEAEFACMRARWPVWAAVRYVYSKVSSE